MAAANATCGVRTPLTSPIQCGECLKKMSDPRLLQCAHTFCLVCIKNHNIAARKLPGDELHCPMNGCDDKFIIPQGGVDNLTRNYFVQQLIATKCEYCLSMPGPSTKNGTSSICKNCNKIMCEPCAKREQHPSSHVVRKITGRKGEDKLPSECCAVHSKAVLQYYCSDCNKAFCAACRDALHPAVPKDVHHCTAVGETAEKFKEQIGLDVKRLVGNNSRCREIMQVQKNDKAELCTRRLKIENDIKSRALKLREQIDREEKNLLKEVRSFFTDRTQKTERVIEKIEIQVLFTESLIRYATELASEGSIGDITQQYDVVHDRAVKLMRLDVIQRALRDMGSAEVNFTGATSVTQSSGGMIGIFKAKNEPRSPTLTDVIAGGEGEVVGITSINSQLFVLRWPSKQKVEVYSTSSTIQRQEPIPIDEISSACEGLASCSTNRCLYISDWGQKTVFKVDLDQRNDKRIQKWSHDFNSAPCGLSVNPSSNAVIVTCDDYIYEFNTHGKMIRKFQPPAEVTDPWHTIQLATDKFLVCYQGPDSGVSIVSLFKRGLQQVSHVEKTSRGDKSIDVLREPRYLAWHKQKDCFLVVDRGMNRLLMLNSSLSDARPLPLSVDGALRDPRCIYLDESKGRLYVGEFKGRDIFVFDAIFNATPVVLPDQI